MAKHKSDGNVMERKQSKGGMAQLVCRELEKVNL